MNYRKTLKSRKKSRLFRRSLTASITKFPFRPFVPSSLSPSVVQVDPRYFRPTKAREKLGWKLEYTLDELIKDMIQSDIQLMQKDAYLRQGGFRTLNYYE